MAAVYTLAALLGAFLNFLIQPVAAKIALPTLGGVPAVWNGCMLFFQAVLLLGYLYAHGLSRLPARWQPALHGAVLLLALLSFPLRFDAPFAIEPSAAPLAWLLTMLFATVAVPYFAVSASAPLLQRWFAATLHRDAHNPYFLYAASNAGSMAALLLYPVAIEPFFPIAAQLRGWEAGVALLCALFFAAALLLYRHAGPLAAQRASAAPPRSGWPERLRWMALAFVPCSLLYAVTAHITTDIASVPLLWIAPLALYLSTFILVFARRPRGGWARELHLPAVLLLSMLVTLGDGVSGEMLLAHLAGFFVIALAVHRALADAKPEAARLTEFFLWMSAGGVLGGAFNTLLAPLLFNGIAEYPLALLASCLLAARPAEWREWRRFAPRLLRAAGLIGGTLLLALWLLAEGAAALGLRAEPFLGYAVAAPAAACGYLAYRRFKHSPAAYALALGLLMLVAHAAIMLADAQQPLLKARNVFGVSRVVYDAKANANFFIHGTTLHGLQRREERHRLVPRAYYQPLGDVFAALPEGLENKPVALMGLGAGTILCFGNAAQRFDVFELDPLVADIAGNPAYFTYLRDCPPAHRILLGDGRQGINAQAEEEYGLIILDAFSSDAIPMHLLTREALLMYREKLRPHGLLAVHISNRFIELRPALAALAAALGLAGAQRQAVPAPEDALWQRESLWVVLARDTEDLRPLLAGGWRPLGSAPPRFLWTDDFSNLFFSLRAVQRFLPADAPPAAP